MGSNAWLTKRRKWFRSEQKDRHLNTNLREFSEERSGHPLPARENDLQHEVLIPCYNHGRFLRDALGSIPQDITTTVIDDASTDDTAEIVQVLRKNFHFNLITNEKNLNQADSLNKAVGLSDNNLFTVLNADDCLTSYCLSAVRSVLEHNPTSRLVGGPFIPFTHSSLLSWNHAQPRTLEYTPKVRLYGPREANDFMKISDLNMAMSSTTFLRSAWEAVGGFRKFEDRVCSCDDRDFQMRVCSLFDVALVEEPLALWRSTSSTGRGQFT
jgi:GT2 family glycosyltransferase